MGLHETDKSGDRRLKPAINANDPVLQRPAHKTLSTSYKSASEPAKQRLVFDQDSIETYDSENRKSLFIGYDPEISKNPVVRIAKPEKDATSTNDSDFIFNSERNVLKIAEVNETTVSVPGAGSAYGVTIAHNLGYLPVSLVNFTDPFVGSSIYRPSGYFNYISATNWQRVNHYVTTTSITFQVELGSGTGAGFFGDWNFKYYLLQETAN